MCVFEPPQINSTRIDNRVLRAATFEGMSDHAGVPSRDYVEHYRRLAEQAPGGIITGFTYVRNDGRAAQPGQAGIESDEKIPAFREVTNAVHASGCPIFLQLAHAGRQSWPAMTGGTTWCPSAVRSDYFKNRPACLSPDRIESIITDFGRAARRAREAGFDGVQVHAAHGYLIHQFIHPAVNRRRDAFGADSRTGIGTLFLKRVFQAIRVRCGSDFPVLVKISANDGLRPRFTPRHFDHLIAFLNQSPVDAIEISCGTMEMPLNIFRGASLPIGRILRFNPRYGSEQAWRRALLRLVVSLIVRYRAVPFRPAYNLRWARRARGFTEKPLISVGGFNSGPVIKRALKEGYTDYVAICRAFIREPDFINKLRHSSCHVSSCRLCNMCAVMCDTPGSTLCRN